MNLSTILNTAWMWKCRREKGVLEQSTHRVAETQASLLDHVLSCNTDSVYGTRYHFEEISTPSEFQRTVPLSTYESYEEYVRQIAQGDKNILTREDVVLFEPTSGSTSGEKLIPYTATLRAQFQRAVSAWIADLMISHPGARRGRAYWSISPNLEGERCSVGGIPIGFETDAAYLGLVDRLLAQKLFVVPSAAGTIRVMDDFRYYSLLHLVAAADLALISVWSPTFLTTLLEPLEEWSSRLCADIREGTLSLPSLSRSSKSSDLPLGFRANPRRADHLEEILLSNLSMPDKMGRIWPRLALISCWTDAAASIFVPRVRNLFPEVSLQPKGLLATEAFVSIPIEGLEGAVLAINSHFFEFQEVNEESEKEDTNTAPFLAHELSIGKQYATIVTTGGGLYRYQMHDLVEVVGYWNECPLLIFIGRLNHTCDLVGEKLQELHVRQVLDGVWAAHGFRPEFSLLLPTEQRIPGYRLYIQGNEIPLRGRLRAALTHDIQRGLEENPYYLHACQFGQLSTVEVHLLRPTAPSAWSIYEAFSTSNGQKAGDIKPTVLESRPGYLELFSKLERYDVYAETDSK